MLQIYTLLATKQASLELRKIVRLRDVNAPMGRNKFAREAGKFSHPSSNAAYKTTMI
jgi:hypothetical protein